MSGQAVHKESLLACFPHQLFIYLIGAENLESFGEFIFLSHAGPDVRVECIRAFHVRRLGRPLDMFIGRRTIFLGADGSETKAQQ